MIELLRDG